MVKTFKEYIDTYVRMNDRYGIKIPGEHHFVATYLLPVLYSISNIVPDFVNPDGMKHLPGDIIYYKNEKCILSFEVKLNKISFTKHQFANWIHPKSRSVSPDYLIALNSKGLTICNWEKFEKLYVERIKSIKEVNDISKYKMGTYSQSYNVNEMMKDIDQMDGHDLVFNCKNDPLMAENNIRKRLRTILIDSHVI